MANPDTERLPYLRDILGFSIVPSVGSLGISDEEVLE